MLPSLYALPKIKMKYNCEKHSWDKSCVWHVQTIALVQENDGHPVLQSVMATWLRFDCYIDKEMWLIHKSQKNKELYIVRQNLAIKQASREKSSH